MLEGLFRSCGLPDVIRSEQRPTVRLGGSRWPEPPVDLVDSAGHPPLRTRPGHPQDNGRIERLHRTLEAETLRPPAPSLALQQARFDRFRHWYNSERPHAALGQTTPASHYAPSPRSWHEPREPHYERDAQIRRVRSNGEIKWRGQLIFVSQRLYGQPVGVIEELGGLGLWYGPIRLGLLDTINEMVIHPRRSCRARTGPTSVTDPLG